MDLPLVPAGFLVGTDLTHAVFLAALAVVGHRQLGAVDSSLLLPLLFGSMPGLYLGTRWASRIRDGGLRPVMGGFLLMIGLGFAVKALI